MSAGHWYRIRPLTGILLLLVAVIVLAANSRPTSLDYASDGVPQGVKIWGWPKTMYAEASADNDPRFQFSLNGTQVDHGTSAWFYWPLAQNIATAATLLIVTFLLCEWLARLVQR